MKNQKKIIGLLSIVLLSGAIIISCTKDEEVVPDNSQNQVEEVIMEVELPEVIAINNIPDYKLSQSGAKWWGWNHSDMAEIAAYHMGLSETRAVRMHNAADDPDQVDGEGTIPLTQQWKHGYVFAYGYYVWGSADDNCEDNINRAIYNFTYSEYWGDYRIGYASHYLQDVANPWHTSANIVQQLSTHKGYEEWISNNWENGHKFKDYLDGDYYYYSISDPAATTRTLAKYSYNKYSTMYDAYIDSDSPVEPNTGNATLVSQTKEVLKAAGRYTKGLIKYTLDEANAW